VHWDLTNKRASPAGADFLTLKCGSARKCSHDGRSFAARVSPPLFNRNRHFYASGNDKNIIARQEKLSPLSPGQVRHKINRRLQ
jgi:hypothetical protein